MVVELVRVVVFQYRANLAALTVSSWLSSILSSPSPESRLSGSEGCISERAPADRFNILRLLFLQAALAKLPDLTKHIVVVLMVEVEDVVVT